MPFSSASSGLLRRMLWPRRRNVAGVGRVDAGEDLHQRGLAGAVLAHQRMDRAALELEAGHCPARRRRGIPCGHPSTSSRNSAPGIGAAFADGLHGRGADDSGHRVSSRATGSDGTDTRHPAAGVSVLRADSVLGDELVHVLGRHELEGDPDLGFDLLALGELDRGVDRTGTWPKASWNTVTSRSPAFM